MDRDASPLESYESALARGELVPDPIQRHVVGHLEDLYQRLLVRQHPQFFRRLKRFSDPPQYGRVRGIYLWGGVGCGKTLLMDAFFAGLPIRRKKRVHFHRFMQTTHELLSHYYREDDPLEAVAKHWAEQAEVLCFDEFYVADIADAMILGGLLKRLTFRGVCVVMTSNAKPENLYPGGLQRQQFLPAIALIRSRLEVVRLDALHDYRRMLLIRSEIYHYPLDEQADVTMRENFERIVNAEFRCDTAIIVNDREIFALYRADGVIWFDFAVFCSSPRSASDYIDVARIFHTVLLSNVPVMGPEQDDEARRFITMIDEFYDRHVNTMISAASAIDELYQGSRLEAAFERTRSRLHEMQTPAYLGKAHLSG